MSSRIATQTQNKKDKKAKKGNGDNKHQESAGEREIQTPPPGAAQSPAQIPTMIPENLIDLLNNTKNNASAVVQRPTTVQESPANNVQQVVVKPQAATALNINAGESPGKTVKLQAETIPDGHRETSAHQVGILPNKDWVMLILHTLERK